MNGLLLDSSYSKYFSLGSSERDIRSHWKNRVIRFNICEKDIDVQDMQDFFLSYSDKVSNEGQVTRMASEYVVERFFSYVKGLNEFDQVSFIEESTQKTWNHDDFMYKFKDNGRKIRVCNRNGSSVITEITRLARIVKGKMEHAIICDPRANDAKSSNFGIRIKAAKDIIGILPCLSYMSIYPCDVFCRELSRKANNYRGTNYIESNLNINQTNLILVYSIPVDNLRKIGNNAWDNLQKERNSLLESKL